MLKAETYFGIANVSAAYTMVGAVSLKLVADIYRKFPPKKKKSIVIPKNKTKVTYLNHSMKVQ